jgi:crotonyl-CoA carboxylase/reductase
MGYETPDGSSCQFVAVQGQQILPKPKHLTWEDAASYVLTYFTAYRMLVQRCKLRPGQLVLVWGGAGGLGVYAIQLCREWGADAIAVVSSDEKGEYCQSLGAMGYINRNSIKGYRNEDGEDPKHNPLKKVMKPFQRKIWEICGCQRSPDIVFEHPGKQTFALSVFLAARFGKIVICGATSGYDLTFDARHLWMHQKQIIGSHYANFLDCRQGNTLITKNKIQIINNHTYSFDEFALAHQDLYEHKVLGNTSILIFPDTVKGLKTRAEIEAQFKA